MSPVPSKGTQPPLVSVLVRSLDRPLLAQALASLALQDHDCIEVLVIAARPGHGPVPATAGRHPVRLLPADGPRPRSVAANVGLDAAAGELLLFLDDDDWLAPDHVSRLVRALLHLPDRLAAYAGVSLVDAQGRPLGQLFDLPFDAVRLLSGNLTPIHAVLFSRRLCVAGCRFDESLDRYEDWDFWLQVARLTVPVHVPGVSAFYRIHESSGVHEDAGAASVSTQRIHAKWLHQVSQEQLGELMKRVWSHDDLAWRLGQAEALLNDRAAMRAHLDQQQEALRGLTDHVSLQAAVADRWQAGQQAALQSLAAQVDEQLAVQQARCESLARQLGQQEALAGQLERLLAEERHERALLHHDIEALRRSTSWRLTRPLRALMSLWRGSRSGR